MKFEHIMLNEMSRASDRTLGKNSLNNLLHILADYMKSKFIEDLIYQINIHVL